METTNNTDEGRNEMDNKTPVQLVIGTGRRHNDNEDFTVIVTRDNETVYVTSAQGISHARMLAEGHVDNGIGWRAVIASSADGSEHGTYTAKGWAN